MDIAHIPLIAKTKPKLKKPPIKLASLMKMGLIKNVIKAAIKKHEGIYNAIDLIISGCNVAPVVNELLEQNYLIEADPSGVIRHLKSNMGDIDAWAEAVRTLNRNNSSLVVVVPAMDLYIDPYSNLFNKPSERVIAAPYSRRGTKSLDTDTTVIDVNTDYKLLHLSAPTGSHGVYRQAWMELDTLLRRKITVGD